MYRVLAPQELAQSPTRCSKAGRNPTSTSTSKTLARSDPWPQWGWSSYLHSFICLSFHASLESKRYGYITYLRSCKLFLGREYSLNCLLDIPVYQYLRCQCVSTATGGSSHPSGPNFGMTIIFPKLFFAGFEKVHKGGFPRDDNHTGLTTVRPFRQWDSETAQWLISPTF